MSLKYELIPFKGIGIITFGMTRQQCRSALNSTHRTFKRNEFAKNFTDYFTDLKLFLEFDEDDICQGIELHSYSHLVYEGKHLFDFDFFEFKTYYSAFSKRYEIEQDVSVTFFDLGFGASKGSDNDSLETVTIFPEKYW
jgi:hypothetical protein